MHIIEIAVRAAMRKYSRRAMHHIDVAELVCDIKSITAYNILRYNPDDLPKNQRKSLEFTIAKNATTTILRKEYKELQKKIIMKKMDKIVCIESLGIARREAPLVMDEIVGYLSPVKFQSLLDQTWGTPDAHGDCHYKRWGRALASVSKRSESLKSKYTEDGIRMGIKMLINTIVLSDPYED